MWKIPQFIQNKLFYLIFILILTGCGEIQTKTRVSDIDVYVGFEGIVMEFMKNAPPQTVLERSTFPILIKISNRGTHTILPKEALPEEKQAFIAVTTQPFARITSIEGYNIKRYQDKENVATFSLDGKTRLNLKGSETIATILAQAQKLEPQSQQLQSTVTATLCYPYKTTLSATICIDTDYTGLKPVRKICSVKEIPFAKGQGAPIAITKIQPLMLPVEVSQGKYDVKPQFTIHIEDKGNGNPIRISQYNRDCILSNTTTSATASSTTTTALNRAAVRAFTRGNAELECKSNGVIEFTDKKAVAQCEFKGSVPEKEDAYTTPLKVEVDYGYVSTITTNYIIQKPQKIN